ncbi:hypothetical protein PQ610_06095 [Tardisphaera miroshnichenkoae]
MRNRDEQELLSIFRELKENPREYSSRGALNSHGRLLALRFGGIALRMGLVESSRFALGDGDYEKCMRKMESVMNSLNPG